ncbi:hypothetical protein ACF1CY_004689 [Providencia rettgeri]
MNFTKFNDLVFFLRKRWLPLDVKMVEINDHETHFYYEGFIRTLADSLHPEIEMQIDPDAEDWECDEEEMGMNWENDYLSISAVPVDEGVFMIIVNELEGKIKHLEKFMQVFLAQQNKG